ncbi:hypothetical protein [Actinacidiphila sp. DG2A-62]|uniref:hypothetical protein n=1 Tax=Actinacidiphila sp. DG2A-62 TaxID=3108821 RepID=UPI003FA3BB03
MPEDARLAASWDRDLTALTGELRRARAAVHDVPLPASLTATQLLRLAADPDGLARELARPTPRPPARPRAAAPASTPGWSPASTYGRCSAPRTCRGSAQAPATGTTARRPPTSPTSATSPRSRRRSCAPRTRTGRRTPSSRPSSSCWPGG